MKTLIKTLPYIAIIILFSSCDIKKEASKTKNDIDYSEQIETKEVRKGDTVTFIVPKITYKDTIITTVSRQGTILKTYYNSQGQISKSDCISAEIDLLRIELRNLKDNSTTKEKTKDESYFNNPLIWVIIVIALVFIIKK